MDIRVAAVAAIIARWLIEILPQIWLKTTRPNHINTAQFAWLWLSPARDDILTAFPNLFSIERN
jgi:hypothetical protein